MLNVTAQPPGIGEPSVTLSPASIEDFQDSVDRWGADLATWPEPQRAAALTLLDQSPAARAVLAEARRLRDLARGAATVSAPRGLVQRILDAALDEDGEGADRHHPTPLRRHS